MTQTSARSTFLRNPALASAPESPRRHHQFQVIDVDNLLLRKVSLRKLGVEGVQDHFVDVLGACWQLLVVVVEL